MDFRQLRYFVAVAEEGNFGLAAARLHVTQPPVTRQIHALEEALRVKLFLRSSRGTTLTEAGKIYLAEVRLILERAQRAGERSRAADRGEIGSLNVAFFGSSIYRAVPILLRRFRSRHPGVQLSLVRMSKDAQIDALRTGTIDIGFGRYFPQAPDIATEVVSEERILVALPEEDPLTAAATVRLSDLAARPIILFPIGGRPSFADAVLGILSEANIKPTIGAEAEDPTAALALVSIGAGVCIAPESIAGIAMPGVRFMQLEGDAPLSPTSCIYLKNNNSPILTSFLGSMQVTNQAKPPTVKSAKARRSRK